MPYQGGSIEHAFTAYILNEATTHAGFCELNGRIEMVNVQPFRVIS
jgi:hypothetical protein